MAKDYGNISRQALARVNALSETAIFWGLVISVVIVAYAMIKGMFA